MATIQVKNLANQTPRWAGAVGNQFVEQYNLAVDAAGKVNGVDLGTGDVIQLGYLKAGWTLHPAATELVITDAFGAGVTGILGFAYVDGVDLAGADAQDNDYFVTSSSLASAAVLRGNNAAAKPITLKKDAYLILTLTGTAHDATTANADAFIRGINSGVL